MIRQLTREEWAIFGGAGLQTVLYIYAADIDELLLALEDNPGVQIINLAQLFEGGKIAASAGGGISSNPPEAGRQVKNIFVTPEGKLQIDYEDGT